VRSRGGKEQLREKNDGEAACGGGFQCGSPEATIWFLQKTANVADKDQIRALATRVAANDCLPMFGEIRWLRHNTSSTVPLQKGTAS